ncbi:hypothetical protein [Saccharopolyspora spinosa]|uniref:hypothetical protein n=1 Tax=Saccharopolyspora spinosa TaxID=60894 RepID=UPI000237B4CF|nr:hypothetical protein [Saccharopolyspora spinosa]
MDLVHDLGYRKLVREIGEDLVGGRRLFPVIRMANELYGAWPEIGTLRDLARDLRVAEARDSVQQLTARKVELEESLDLAESVPEVLATGSIWTSLLNPDDLRAQIGELAGRVEAERGVLDGLVSDVREEGGQDDTDPRGRERTAEDLTGDAESPGAGASSSAGAGLRGAESAGVLGAGVEGAFRGWLERGCGGDRAGGRDWFAGRFRAVPAESGGVVLGGRSGSVQI